MATSGKNKPNSKSSGGYSNYSSNSELRVDSDSDNDSFAIILIVILLVVILFFLPLLMWMYVDVRQMEIRVNKALTRIEGK